MHSFSQSGNIDCHKIKLVGNSLAYVKFSLHKSISTASPKDNSGRSEEDLFCGEGTFTKYICTLTHKQIIKQHKMKPCSLWSSKNISIIYAYYCMHYIYLHDYVCTYACVCMHTYMHSCMHIHTHVCVCICMHTHTHTNYIYVYVYMDGISCFNIFR